MCCLQINRLHRQINQIINENDGHDEITGIILIRNTNYNSRKKKQKTEEATDYYLLQLVGLISGFYAFTLVPNS